jgi:ankyrin repeat protein
MGHSGSAMDASGTDIESVPGKSLPDDQYIGATIPLMMMDCNRNKNHDVSKELGKKNGLGCPAHYDAVECNSKGALLSKEVVAVPKDNMEIVEFGRTPLQKAAEDNNIETVKLLLERQDIQVDAQDNFGYTALHRATNHANPDREIISLLIYHGADIGVKNEFGDTPLHLATDQANPDTGIINLLIGHGADIEVQNKSGKIPRLSTADYQELLKGCISIVTAGKNTSNGRKTSG